MGWSDMLPTQDIVAWLVASAPTTIDTLVPALAERLLAARVPLSRLNMSLLAMHPELEVRNVGWSPEEGTKVRLLMRATVETPYFSASPVPVIRGGASVVRRTLIGPDAQLDFPICRELAVQGHTDYLALPLIYSDGRRSFVSFVTRAPNGFSDEHVDALGSLLPALSLRTELGSAVLATDGLLKVYLGRNAANRVMSGSFLRGSGVAIRAAVWACDLRGFTSMSERHSPTQMARILDRYFEAAVDAIDAQGGEVLKFIGDAILAIFPVGDDEGATCRRAVAAARQAVASLRATPDGAEPLQIGVAVHVGEVFYGNVGGAARLDFTVIGPTVNEAFRLETLCKQVGRPIVVSAAAATCMSDDTLVDLGEHHLKGVTGTRRVFGTRP
jgi:adenylate cyclase